MSDEQVNFDEFNANVLMVKAGMDQLLPMLRPAFEICAMVEQTARAAGLSEMGAAIVLQRWIENQPLLPGGSND